VNLKKIAVYVLVAVAGVVLDRKTGFITSLVSKIGL